MGYGAPTINGRKAMANWGEITLLIEVISPPLIAGFPGPTGG